MKIFRLKKEMGQYLADCKKAGKTIGFVPTLGALHDGHISLVKKAARSNDITVVSIFVNPRQFNQPSDFEKYPRTIAADIKLLVEGKCDVLYLPDVNDVYRGHKDVHPNLHGLELQLEGAFRPGHFDGVVQVVYALLQAVTPNQLYMGLKDFQQQAIIQRMISELNMDVQLIPVPTLREKNGLARSSRNVRLTPQQRNDAGIIYQTLQDIRDQLKLGITLNQALNKANKTLSKIPNTKLEYILACDPITLNTVKKYTLGQPLVILIAIWWGDVRLIDNIIL